MSPGFPATIVLEWENVLLAGRARARAALQRLRGQAGHAPGPVDLVVVHDPEALSPTTLAREIRDVLGPPDSGPLPWRTRGVPGAHYYELKNAGARAARGEVVAFLDSDVLPDTGWLAALLAPFADPAVQVVAGESHLDVGGLVSRAFALGWFFPLRSDGNETHDRARHFFANNVAFRRSLFGSRPFPPMPGGAARGACTELATRLRAEGVRIWKTTRARVAHPPPNGLRHTWIRALSEGRDWVAVRGGEGRGRSALAALAYFSGRSRRAIRRSWRHRRRVALPAPLVPAAWCVMTAYYMTALVGAWATCAAPRAAAARWRI